MKTLYIVRGLPGSGKSTLARNLVGKKDYCHKEADMFFVDEKGEYAFKAWRLKEAHDWCRKEVERLMQQEHESIAVSNTFTREWEMKSYFELAEKYGYRTFTIVVENRHRGENVHGVPADKIQEMKDRFEIML